MKTLLFTSEFPPQKGGVANYYHNLFLNWPNKDILVLTEKKDDQKYDNVRVLNKKLFNRSIKPNWLPAIRSLAQTIKREKVSIVLVGQILPLGIAAYLLSFFINFKYVVIIHGMDWTWALKKRRKKYISKKILKRADKIICGNSYVAELIKKEMKDHSLDIKILNPGVDKPPKYDKIKDDKERLLKTYSLKDKFLLLSLGRLVKRKGVDKVLEVLPKIISEHPDLKYLIAGKGPEEKNLKTKAKNLDLDKESVIFLGEINEQEKWALLNLCDLLVMPSREIEGDFEGFGIVYLEANLMSKPVIAGDSGGVRDAVEHNHNGIMVDPEKTEEIKKAIIKLKQEKKLNQKLVKQGKERVEKNFFWPQKTEELYNLLNK